MKRESDNDRRRGTKTEGRKEAANNSKKSIIGKRATRLGGSRSGLVCIMSSARRWCTSIRYVSSRHGHSPSVPLGGVVTSPGRHCQLHHGPKDRGRNDDGLLSSWFCRPSADEARPTRPVTRRWRSYQVRFQANNACSHSIMRNATFASCRRIT